LRNKLACSPARRGRREASLEAIEQALVLDPENAACQPCGQETNSQQ